MLALTGKYFVYLSLNEVLLKNSPIEIQIEKNPEPKFEEKPQPLLEVKVSLKKEKQRFGKKESPKVIEEVKKEEMKKTEEIVKAKQKSTSKQKEKYFQSKQS